MSGAEFTRKKYDNYQHRLHESTFPLSYRLFPGASQNCEIKRHARHLGKQGVSISASRAVVDVESDLKSLNRKITDNIHMQHMPNDSNEAMIHFPESTSSEENSRLTSPPSHNREIGFFDDLIFVDVTHQGLEPSGVKATRYPGRTRIDTRQLTKDNYQPELPKLFNKEAKYIESHNMAQIKARFCEPIKDVCGVYSGPLNDFVYYPPFCTYK